MASKTVALGRTMIDEAEKMYGGDDMRFNTLLRIGNELVRIGLPFQKKSLKDFSTEDLKFIRDYALKHKPTMELFS